MELGGAEMALLGLLHALDPNRVDVDLFIYSHQGPLMQHIPGWVNLLPEVGAYSVIEKPLKQALSEGHFGVAFGRIQAKLQHKLYRLKHPVTGIDDGAIFQYVGNAVEPFLPKINPHTEYDLCISFLNPHNFALYKVRAKKRLAWIHTDYKKSCVNAELELPVWDGFDYIATISEDVHESFAEVFPKLSKKLLPIENIMPGNLVRTRAEQFDATAEMPGEIKLLSIGRFCSAKNYDNVPDICRRILKMGIDVRWYIIGYGGDEGLIRQRIAEAGVEDNVIILGKRENPYPYIKACDFYVQPSRYEGKSVTVREAQYLGKPVIITAYPTASSQVVHQYDGVIVPMDNEGCAQGIKDFICNPTLQKQIVNNLKMHDYANTSEVDKIYSLIEN